MKTAEVLQEVFRIILNDKTVTCEEDKENNGQYIFSSKILTGKLSQEIFTRLYFLRNVGGIVFEFNSEKILQVKIVNLEKFLEFLSAPNEVLAKHSPIELAQDEVDFFVRMNGFYILLNSNEAFKESQLKLLTQKDGVRALGSGSLTIADAKVLLHPYFMSLLEQTYDPKELAQALPFLGPLKDILAPEFKDDSSKQSKLYDLLYNDRYSGFLAIVKIIAKGILTLEQVRELKGEDKHPGVIYALFTEGGLLLLEGQWLTINQIKKLSSSLSSLCKKESIARLQAIGLTSEQTRKIKDPWVIFHLASEYGHLLIKEKLLTLSEAEAIGIQKLASFSSENGFNLLQQFGSRVIQLHSNVLSGGNAKELLNCLLERVFSLEELLSIPTEGSAETKDEDPFSSEKLGILFSESILNLLRLKWVSVEMILLAPLKDLNWLQGQTPERFQRMGLTPEEIKEWGIVKTNEFCQRYYSNDIKRICDPVISAFENGLDDAWKLGAKYFYNYCSKYVADFFPSQSSNDFLDAWQLGPKTFHDLFVINPDVRNAFSMEFQKRLKKAYVAQGDEECFAFCKKYGLESSCHIKPLSSKQVVLPDLSSTLNPQPAVTPSEPIMESKTVKQLKQ